MGAMRAIPLALLSALLLTPSTTGQDTGPSPEPKADDSAHAGTKKRLQAALQTSAETTDTAFVIEWGPDQAARPQNPFGRLLGGVNSGKATGSWHKELRSVKFDGDEEDQVLVAGARTIARDATRDWCVRSGRYADGNRLNYVPDPQALLAQLAAWPLAVTQRSAGAIDDRPVEIISVTLNPDQIGELLWSGSLPETMANGLTSVLRIAAGGRGQNLRTAATPPDVTVDLAIAIEPGANRVHEIRGRAWKKAQGRRGGVIAFPAGRVQVLGGQANDDEEGDDEQEVDPKAPLVYENGLPKRPRKKMTITNFRLGLSAHGQTEPEVLNDRQKRLLR